MDKQEFFLLIPAIIYGVAIIDLLKVVGHKKNYWEQVAWGLYSFVFIVFSWTELYQKLESIVDSLINFFLIIVQAILYAQAVKVITPEEKDENTEDYFLEHKRTYFLLLSAIIVMNGLCSYYVYDDNRAEWVRPLAFIAVLICAFWDNIKVRTTILFLFLLQAILVISGFSMHIGIAK